MEDGLSPTDTKWLPHSTDLPEFINIDPITFHALRLNMAISLLSKASAASPLHHISLTAISQEPCIMVTHIEFLPFPVAAVTWQTQNLQSSAQQYCHR
jgi:hypothetical protein